jgi:ketosteroid isomerase-like protein
VPSKEESERVVRQFYDVLGEGGSAPELMEKLGPLLAPDAEWVNPDHAIERGTRVGLEGWTTALENTQGGLGSDVAFRIEELIVLADDRVFVRGNLQIKGTSSGVELEGRPMGNAWTIQDGRVLRLEWSFEADELLERARREASAPASE